MSEEIDALKKEISDLEYKLQFDILSPEEQFAIKNEIELKTSTLTSLEKK